MTVAPENGSSSSSISDRQDIEFVTMGMFILDEIHYLPPKPPVTDILGGAGSYSTLGARLLSAPPLSKRIGWVVDRGSDFPDSVTEQIEAWDTTCILRDTPERLTTRGWNGYDEKENRAFKYLTPKLRLDADSLDDTLLQSKAFHMVCSPLRCIDLVTTILVRRREVDPEAIRPLFIWEPVPDLCTPDELLNCTNALPYVDICSPNHMELGGFMGVSGVTENGDVDKRFVEDACEQLLGAMPLQSFSIVVRAGKDGCYIAKSAGRKRSGKPGSKRVRRKSAVRYRRGGLTMDMDMEALFAGLLTSDGEGGFEFNREAEDEENDCGIERWLLPYHTDSTKVVDPTGGGNAFLGGLAVALARGKSLEEASMWGSVAASLAIEQVGMPTLSVDEEGEETWNGIRVMDRLKEFQERVNA